MILPTEGASQRTSLRNGRRTGIFATIVRNLVVIFLCGSGQPGETASNSECICIKEEFIQIEMNTTWTTPTSSTTPTPVCAPS